MISVASAKVKKRDIVYLLTEYVHVPPPLNFNGDLAQMIRTLHAGVGNAARLRRLGHGNTDNLSSRSVASEKACGRRRANPR